MTFRERSGSLRPNTIPSFVCLPHWRNSGRGSRYDCGIREKILYGEMKRVEVSYVVRGECNFSRIMDPMGVAVSDMTDIHPVPAR